MENIRRLAEAGHLVAEYYPWYESAALMKVNDLHRQPAREQP